MRALGVIPARLHSTRLPRKLLLDSTGKPLIQYAWEAASRATMLSEVIVATDSPEIAEAVRSFGGRAELTREHPSGTDRIAEVVRRCAPRAEIVVNIQGDEPEIEPEKIDLLVQLLEDNFDADMATLATTIRTREQLEDPSCVKVVCGEGRALYFSRSPIPYVRDANVDDLLRENSPWLLHLGVYAYRRQYLLKLTSLSPSHLEKLEKLEQLRALEAGGNIQVGVVAHSSSGIDTPHDYAQFVDRLRSRAA